MFGLFETLDMLGKAAALCLSIGAATDLPPERAQVACAVAPTVVLEAQRRDLPPARLAALIWTESRYKPRAKSRAGACGLTQVIPRWSLDRSTGRRWTCAELMDPHESVRVGARHLRQITDRYARGDDRVGLCYYNAGNACLRNRSWARGMSYVRKVLQVQGRIERANPTGWPL